jgi:hypothetical protein
MTRTSFGISITNYNVIYRLLVQKHEFRKLADKIFCTSGAGEVCRWAGIMNPCLDGSREAGIRETRCPLHLFKECRTALIAAAIAGEIDVPDSSG